jgi:hypothetical protein
MKFALYECVAMSGPPDMLYAILASTLSLRQEGVAQRAPADTKMTVK